jgi:ribonucleoside-triphosphate reductase (formate)
VPKLIDKVIKRDGRVVEFSRANIESAIRKAARATNTKLDVITVSNYAIKLIEEKFKDKTPTVEEVQDAVEKTLIHFDFSDAAKAYILYRQNKQYEREGTRLVNVNKLVEDYIDNKDWRIKENANTAYSVSGLTFHIAGDIIAKYSLNKYPKEIRDAHLNGSLHLHDLSLGLICQYCNGLSLEQLILEGIDGVPGKTSSKPAGHLSSICSHMLNYLGTCQLEAAGAEAYSSVDTLLAPFIKKDKLTYEQVKQNIQSLFFNLNVPSRWANQAPFSNFTLDWTLPDDKKGDIPMISGKEMPFTYDECIDEMGMLNRAMMEVVTEGDKHGSPFTFPIITFNIDNEFDWNGQNTDFLFEATAKYGPFYFANFMNSGLKKSDIRSLCCRLSLNLNELRNKMGGVFGSGDKTGSVGVCTMNLPQLGYLSNDDRELFERLDYQLHLAKQSLEMKRRIITENLNKGLMPYTKRYLGSFNTYFSTIGIIGMNELLLNYMDVGIWDPEGKKLGLKIMDHIRSRLIEFQQETGNLYNLEATPAEGTTRRLANLDKKNYPDIIVANNEDWKKGIAAYYTNSTNLPVGYTNDLFESLDLEEEFLTKYTGGCVKHIYLGERMPSADSARNLVKKVCSNYKIPYFSLTPSFSVCKKHGYIKGVHEKCPIEE